jgi:hypothetical protein
MNRFARCTVVAVLAALALSLMHPAQAKRNAKRPKEGIPKVGVQPVALKGETDKTTAVAILQAVCAPADNLQKRPDPSRAEVRLVNGMLTDCTVKGGEVYRSGSAGLWFVIDNTVPSFTEVRRTPSSYVATRSWSLADQEVGTPGLDMVGGEKQQILPELYPATDGDRYTIVLRHSYFEGYSGGGGSWAWGWFYGLRDTEPRMVDRYGQLPLSCDQLIRACFTEKEYKLGGRCHDNYLGHLQILQAKSHPWRMRWDRADLMSAPNGGAVDRDQTLLRFKRDADGRFRNGQELTTCGEGPQ